MTCVIGNKRSSVNESGYFSGTNVLLLTCLVVFQYDPDARLIVVDVEKPKTDKTTNLAHMAYYMEKDVGCRP